MVTEVSNANRSRDIFVPAVGQYANIGDIVLRRQLLSWLRPLGRLHVFIGHAPEGYDEGLALTEGDRVYRSFTAWYLAGLASAARGRANYIFKPGEIQLTILGLKEHVSLAPLTSFIRLRGGTVARVGAGARNFARLPRFLMRPSLAIPQRTWWRDPVTADYLGGQVMPDLAFGEGDEVDRFASSERDILAVSMRGDRRGVPEQWIEGVRSFAARHSLKIYAVTQVQRDDALSRSLAERLGGTWKGWDGKRHHAQESELNAIYRRTLVTVSDRLHVLIAAYTHGAAPAAVQTDASTKISRHFQAIGVTGVACNSLDMQPGAIDAFLEGRLREATAMLDALPAARARLEAVRQELTRLVAGP
jgi:hypothetical protein